MFKETCIGDVKSSSEESFSSVVNHINVKRVQAMDFEKDKYSPETRVLQADFAMNYSCSYEMRSKVLCSLARALPYSQRQSFTKTLAT